MKEDITIYLAIRKRLFRELIATHLLQENYKIVGSKKYPSNLKKHVITWNPSIVLLSLSDTSHSEFNQIKSLKTANQSIKFIGLITKGFIPGISSLLKIGFRGMIHVQDRKKAIARCIESVMAGSQYFSSKIKEQFFVKDNSMSEKSSFIWIKKLTKREIEILRKVVQLYSNQGIANELFISYKTVINHKQNICKKLQISGRNALLRFGLKHKNVLRVVSD